MARLKVVRQLRAAPRPGPTFQRWHTCSAACECEQVPRKLRLTTASTRRGAMARASMHGVAGALVLLGVAATAWAAGHAPDTSVSEDVRILYLTDCTKYSEWVLGRGDMLGGGSAEPCCPFHVLLHVNGQLGASPSCRAGWPPQWLCMLLRMSWFV